jgi:hypothetical protein
MSHDLYCSYLIRAWQESSADGLEVRWQGEVESVQMGRKWRFDNLNDLLTFIRTQVEALASDVSENKVEVYDDSCSRGYRDAGWPDCS